MVIEGSARLPVSPRVRPFVLQTLHLYVVLVLPHILYPSTNCHRSKCTFTRFSTCCGLKLKHNIEHVNSQNEKHFNEVIIYRVQSKSFKIQETYVERGRKGDFGFCLMVPMLLKVIINNIGLTSRELPTDTHPKGHSRSTMCLCPMQLKSRDGLA